MSNDTSPNIARSRRLRRLPLLTTALALISIGSAFSQETPGEGECDPNDPSNLEKLKLIGPEFNIGPGSLKKAEIPTPSNLGEFVKDKNATILLGKALFWDSQVGSDGVQACATCHFAAGADPRSKNQIAPGGRGPGDDTIFDMFFQAKTPEASAIKALAVTSTSSLTTFELHPPNSALTASDFPLHKLSDITDRTSAVISDVDDVISSQGVFRHNFVPAAPGAPKDDGVVLKDDIFNIRGTNTRRVEPRNTPSVINAIFNHRNFWDGRAQEIFNGRNIDGVRDQSATIVKALSASKLVPVKVRIDNASLASLSVGPPLSADEMTYEGRSFPEIGKRLLSAQPLVGQIVSRTDSVLGPFSSGIGNSSDMKGLVGTYRDYVSAAFHEAWWRADMRVDLDSSGRELYVSTVEKPSPGTRSYSLMEYNFSLFYGLALQVYMATLVSDDAKIDRHYENLESNKPGLLTEKEEAGLELFKSTKARCADCHHGPEFAGPNIRALKRGFLAPDHPGIKPPFSFWQPPEEVERMFIGSCEVALYNQGFYNIGVRPFVEDLGIGGVDRFGNPLSAAQVLADGSKIANVELRTLPIPRLSTLMFPSLASNNTQIVPVPEIREGERTAVLGAFKMPSLRNVALTSPYFHTGGYLTLRQVVEFYNRGGDFHDWVSKAGVAQDQFMDLGIGKLNLTEDEIDSLVAFLETLTDERVVSQAAPFDHPQIFVPDGHVIEETPTGPVVRDLMVEVPAVGAGGGTPIKLFLEFSAGH